MVFTFNSSTSAPSLCSALAIADSSTFLMICAPFFGLKASRLSAFSTGRPRIWSATSRPFWAESRTPYSVARVCMLSPYFFSPPAAGAGAAGAAPAGAPGAAEAPGPPGPPPPDLAAAAASRSFLSAMPWLLKMRVRANSPSLCPTMFSEMYTGTCCLPLWTAIVSPTKSVRMVDRIHRDAAHGGPYSAPADAAGLADRLEAVLLVAYFADGGAAVDVHLADLARAQPQLRVASLSRKQLNRGARGARKLCAPARLHLDAVNRGADRDIPQRQGIPRFDRRLYPGHQLR